MGCALYFLDVVIDGASGEVEVAADLDGGETLIAEGGDFLLEEVVFGGGKLDRQEFGEGESGVSVEAL